MTPDHVLANRSAWDIKAAEFVGPGERSWASPHPHWGIWGVPEADLGLLPDVDGLDVVELGCGTAYVSAWLQRRGAHVVGIDNSPLQLATARRLQREHERHFPLVWADAERAPLAGQSFDLAISEYGACLWCDPYRWLPEAARLLRPGGRLIFLTNSVQLVLCADDDDTVPAGAELLRPLFGLHRVVWPDQPDAVEFHLPHGEMIRALRTSGFVVDDLVEIQVPPDARTNYGFVDAAWASRWPSEEVWFATRA